MPVKNIIKGLISFIPYSSHIYKKIKPQTSHSSSNTRFCYSLWLRIIVILHKNDLENKLNHIAEIGGSSSFGIGIAALISGVQSYSSLEIARFEMTKGNLKLFDELVELFRNKADIPNETEFPNINIKLESYKFPDYILSDSKLDLLLTEERLSRIKNSLLNTEKDLDNSMIRYYVPWEGVENVVSNSFDLIFSRAVMEHISDYKRIYYKLGKLLKQDGVMIHDIEYHNHKIGRYWNSHWCISRFLWYIIRGRKIGIINRLTHSMHLNVLNDLGFNIIFEERSYRPSIIDRSCLSNDFRDMSAEDLNTFGGFFLIKNSI